MRGLDDTVDRLHADIKDYLIRIPRHALGEQDTRRWTGIINFSINLEQVADTIERAISEVEAKKIRLQRDFSDQGMAEIEELHRRLVDNLRLSAIVILHGNLGDARQLLDQHARFGALERACVASHLARLMDRSATSAQTSALHIDLIGELGRINTLVASPALSLLAPGPSAFMLREHPASPG